MVNLSYLNSTPSEAQQSLVTLMTTSTTYRLRQEVQVSAACCLGGAASCHHNPRPPAVPSHPHALLRAAVFSRSCHPWPTLSSEDISQQTSEPQSLTNRPSGLEERSSSHLSLALRRLVQVSCSILSSSSFIPVVGRWQDVCIRCLAKGLELINVRSHQGFLSTGSRLYEV